MLVRRDPRPTSGRRWAIALTEAGAGLIVLAPFVARRVDGILVGGVVLGAALMTLGAWRLIADFDR